jgi:hypothetical protein
MSVLKSIRRTRSAFAPLVGVRPLDRSTHSAERAKARTPTWQPLAGNIPTIGPISATGDFQHGQQWCLLAADGHYRSSDGGKTLEKVLDEKGTAVSRKIEPAAK